MGVRSDTMGSDLVDPLVDKSLLSLFPRTFNSTQFPNPNSSISDVLDTHLKASVLSSPDKLLKQTKTILEEAVFAEKEKVPRERRPALGLKRAKFSAKPIPSQPAVSSLDFSIDVDKLSDPKEYFAAFERMENAKKEVQRLKGEPLLDLDQNRASLAPRHRRPSLLGRSATYTHRFSSSISVADVDATLLTSQETFDSDIVSPTRSDVLLDATVTKNSPSVRVPESKSTAASKVSELDELLCSNYEGLDEDGVQDLLRDKLQIKTVDIGKAFFPDWRVQLRESLTSSSALRKKNDAVFHLSSKNKATRSGEQVSPAKSKSPLASISLLNKHIAKRSPSMDPFSPLHIDLSSEEATDPTTEAENRADQTGQSDEVDARKNLLEIRSSTAHEKENIGVSGEDPFVSVEKDADPISKPKEKEDGVGQSDEVDARKNLLEIRNSTAHEKENIGVSGEDPFVSVVKDADPISKPKEKEDGVAQFEQIGNRKDSCESGRSPVHVEENIAISGEDSLALASNDVGPASEPERHEDEVDAAQLPGRKLIFEGAVTENSNSNGVENGRTGEPSSTENISVEEPTKEAVGSSKRRLKEKEKSKVPSEGVVSEETSKKGRQAKKSELEAPVTREARNKRRKVESSRPGVSKGGRELRRSSLYYAGTNWEAGIRRSTRIRMRPLEYWRGERFLYGRVHQSLVTVIGVKYADAEEPGVKVKSFVSDEYRDMVELASLH